MISLSHWGMFEFVGAEYRAASLTGLGFNWGAASNYQGQLANSAQAAVNSYYQRNKFGTLD